MRLARLPWREAVVVLASKGIAPRAWAALQPASINMHIERSGTRCGRIAPPPKGPTMPPVPNAADLNVQPRQRRVVYERLAKLPAGRSVRALLDDFAIPESELRETLRKLDHAGLARSTRGTWWAVPLETAQPPSDTPDRGSGTPADD
jgi:hypothetical protein